jgi:hypothetical protein
MLGALLALGWPICSVLAGALGGSSVWLFGSSVGVVVGAESFKI